MLRTMLINVAPRMRDIKCTKPNTFRTAYIAHLREQCHNSITKLFDNIKLIFTIISRLYSAYFLYSLPVHNCTLQNGYREAPTILDQHLKIMDVENILLLLKNAN